MKIIMLFPGYGSQFVGMAKELYDESRIIQEYFEEASNCLNVNFVKLCFASSDIELGKMPSAYTATFLVSSALFALLKEEGIVPDAVTGYNLGEYSAIYAAGGFSFPDGLYLLNKFATFYQETLEKVEVAILQIKGVPTETIEDFCYKASKGEQNVFVAIYNTEADTVVAGHADAVEYVREWVTKNHPKAAIEDRAHEVGLHSDYMNEVAEKFALYLEKVDFKDLAYPFFVDDQRIDHGDDVKARVIDHICMPILWDAVLSSLVDYDLIIEVGPGSMLSSMAKNKYPDKLIYAVNKRSDIDNIKQLLEKTKETSTHEVAQSEE